MYEFKLIGEVGGKTNGKKADVQEDRRTFEECYRQQRT